MITIPTSELIGGLTDMVPHISNPKDGYTAGVKLAWDGEALHFTVYDVLSAATVLWLPGEGDEAEVDDEHDEEIEWGGTDDPWTTFLWLPQVKEIVKVFRLPAKLWRTPVNVKCSPTADRLTIEREDGPRVGRFLQVSADTGKLKDIPDVRTIAYDERRTPAADGVAAFSPSRLAAFGVGRPLGVLKLEVGSVNEPVGVTMGSRYAGFIYRSDAKGVHQYNLLRDGAGLVTS